ncbi:MAG: ABC transporter permease [Zoogloeaceae bacterium]|jgi:ABC-2 type transport system permease protein|nr:ABC transporter permease [Zoogloeaceae bacterium]
MPALFIRLVALWKKELLTLARDRHGLAALFVMPAVFILVMSLALADTLSGQREAVVGYALVDLDQSALSQAFDAQLISLERIEKQARLPDLANARRRVEAGELAFVVVIPPGFGQQISRDQTPTLRFLVDPAVPKVMQSGFRQQVEAAATRFWLEQALERLGSSMMIPDLGESVGQVGAPHITLETVGHGAKQNAALPSAVQQNVPAWLIFSMFFVVIPISAVFIGERQHGTLQRLCTQQVSFGAVLAGKFLPYLLVNQVQAVVMVGIGRWLVPLCGGEALTLPAGAAALVALWLVSLAVSVAAVGWALFIASLAKSSEQATILGGVGNILMGAIGGIMVPRFVMPAAMQAWTRISPMNWALEGFHHVMLRQGSVADILPAAAALVCFGVAALVVAVFLDHRARTQ